MLNKVDGILAYFRSKGWVLSPHNKNDKSSYILDPPNPKTTWWLPVPRSDSYKYWDRTMEYTVQMLSKIEERSEAEIWDDLLNPFSDRISFKIESEFIYSGSVPLSSFNKLFSGVTGILKSAIKDIETPEKEHKRLWGKSIKKLMDSAQFGQTKKRSFVFNIYIPVVEDNELNLYRKVVIHILDSFASLTDEKWNKKASVNLYRSLCQMDLWEDTVIDIAVKWSPLFPASGHTRTKVHLSRDAIRLAKEEVCR